MEFLLKIERKVLELLKSVPHLPIGVRTWLGNNVWWIAVIGAVLTGIGALALLVGLFGNLALLSSPFSAYYASPTFVAWVVVKTVISLVFVTLTCLLLGFAVSPLKAKQKKGWVLLFALWLLGALSMFVNAILTLNPFAFITSVIFGLLWLAVTGYFLFEIHGQFAHVERSKGVKAKKTA